MNNVMKVVQKTRKGRKLLQNETGNSVKTLKHGNPKKNYKTIKPLEN